MGRMGCMGACSPWHGRMAGMGAVWLQSSARDAWGQEGRLSCMGHMGRMGCMGAVEVTGKLQESSDGARMEG